MMKPNLIVIILSSLIFCSQYVFAQPDRGVTNKPTGEKRLALVIGNGAYQKTSELPNPPNDAADMASTLKELGFEVLSGTNQSKRQMETLIREFGDKLARQGGVGLFFYAGHGLQVKGSNYLIPVEADIPAEDEIDYAAINLDFLLKKMASAGNNLNIVILDACRNNPFARSWRNFRDIGEGSGLAKITPPTGTIMLYATQPGNVASDGSGRNGLFTESLLNQIKKPDVELDTMIKALARDVSEKSEKKQFPWKEGIVTGDFYFAGGGGSNVPRPNPTPTVESGDAEDVLWQEVSKQNTKLAVESYLSEYPKGKYVATAKLKLNVFEAEEQKKIKEAAEQRQTKAAEPQKWEEAKRIDTIESYQSYLTAYPKGEHLNEANQRIGDLNRTGESVNSIGMRFVRIPGKTFSMGKYEVTQAEWKAVMEDLPSKCDKGKLEGDFLGDKKPIICVMWGEALEFIKRLNTSGVGQYRLPTQAEWEYAARAGAATEYYWGNDINQAGDFAWYVQNSGKTIHEVGLKKPNAFGLYDMAGNVLEWCSDNLDQKIGDKDVWQWRGVSGGGNWGDDPKDQRFVQLRKIERYRRNTFLGFRLIRE